MKVCAGKNYFASYANKFISAPNQCYLITIVLLYLFPLNSVYINAIKVKPPFIVRSYVST